ncbi:hypothetical protein [Stackebrandtia nassauensis]|uniref:Uncharacterized protein n=1 Tax=Stackebrandtia nassauensis (strain DSM 44728 / CIP 108903 / NRRL B-16338 / NBRC 102104 / LLR-40K-21) TaxID=446470 RepID=D3Q8X1_STANL|nr:hypothetical protein [Stackebrandtia nassauensis]ADD40580.1 hypothetical protein Snas_0869 [Stackebrandtia nassauensis DSM 44728]
MAVLTGYLNSSNEPGPWPPPKPSVFDIHRPADRSLRLVIHAGLLPMLWAITTCACGERWPCGTVKRHLRRNLGWTVDITAELKDITRQLPKPTSRLDRVWRNLKRHRRGPV